ncbi:hypothetical protein DKX38_011991 [Salix brachista]|uniref:Uncharacterized protein n=1 Tax=Salix brachista TaxID=2182728 RepID=A0A5N5M057_9ROSI|nr:hypothetical protein DKX38_011991 [Salix brachista]
MVRSFNENGMIMASDAVNAADHGIQTGVEAHEQDVGEQNSNGITQLPENFISQIMIENLETNDAEPVGFSDSNFSINSSEFGKAYNIVPTAPCLDIEELEKMEKYGPYAKVVALDIEGKTLLPLLKQKIRQSRGTVDSTI